MSNGYNGSIDPTLSLEAQGVLNPRGGAGPVEQRVQEELLDLVRPTAEHVRRHGDATTFGAGVVVGGAITLLGLWAGSKQSE